MNQNFKIYSVKQIAIPENKVQEFLNDIPDATEVRSYTVGKDTLDIPLPKVQDFLKDAPQAQPLHAYPELNVQATGCLHFCNQSEQGTAANRQTPYRISSGKTHVLQWA